MYRIPRYKIMLVRDGSQPSEVKAISNPADAFSLLSSYLEGTDRENFVVLMVDTKMKIIGINTVSVGALSSTIVHPREIFKPAILSNASSIILAHNHPSGDPTPSREDLEVTKRLVEAGKILGIAVLDHIIIGVDYYSSFKEQGLL